MTLARGAWRHEAFDFIYIAFRTCLSPGASYNAWTSRPTALCWPPRPGARSASFRCSSRSTSSPRRGESIDSTRLDSTRLDSTRGLHLPGARPGGEPDPLGEQQVRGAGHLWHLCDAEEPGRNELGMKTMAFSSFFHVFPLMIYIMFLRKQDKTGVS